MSRLKILKPGFDTADAEYPSLELRNGSLTLTFLDWREQTQRVRFDEVVAMKWQEVEDLQEGEPYDGTCELLDSQWLARHLEEGIIAPLSGHRHLCLNFNACGKLEVICTGFYIE